MGGSSSKDTVKTINKIATNVVAETVNTVKTEGSNSVAITAKANTIVMRGLTVGQAVSVDFNQAIDALKQQNTSQAIADAVKQYAETKGQALVSALDRTRSDVLTDLQNDLNVAIKGLTSQSIASSFSNEVKISGDADNSFELTDVDINQSQLIAARAIVQSKDFQTALNKAADGIDQTTKTADENPIAGIFKAIGEMFTAPLIAAICLVVGVIVVFVLVKKWI